MEYIKYLPSSTQEFQRIAKRGQDLGFDKHDIRITVCSCINSVITSGFNLCRESILKGGTWAGINPILLE